MNSDSDKARAFVGRLLQNPALNGFTALQQEEQIIQFLHANAGQLAPTLSSAQFFPGKNWNQIFSLLLRELIRVTDETVIPELQDVLENRLDFAFVQLIQRSSAASEEISSRLLEYLKQLIAKPETRRELTGPLTAVGSGLVRSYLSEVFLRKSYIHFEITKVQRLRLGMEEVCSFVEMSLLLKPAVYWYVNDSGGRQERATGMVENQYAEKSLLPLKKSLPFIPEQVLTSVAHSCVSFNDNRFIEATARLAAVFSARGRQYQANVKVDRGADTPDKSWFSTARRNYRFYGFDIKMLDECYKIAAENMW